MYGDTTTRPLDATFSLPSQAIIDALHARGWHGRQFAYANTVEAVRYKPAPENPVATVIVDVVNPAPEALVAFHKIAANPRYPVQMVMLDNACSAAHKAALLDCAHVSVLLEHRLSEQQSRNIGALFAEAPLLLFLSDRCVPDLNIVQHYTTLMENPDVVAARGDVHNVEDVKGCVWGRFVLRGKQGAWPVDLSQNLCIRSHVFYSANGFDESVEQEFAPLQLSLALLRQGYAPEAQCVLPLAVVSAGSTFNRQEIAMNRSRAWALARPLYGRELYGCCLFWGEKRFGKLEDAQ